MSDPQKIEPFSPRVRQAVFLHQCHRGVYRFKWCCYDRQPGNLSEASHVAQLNLSVVG
jgi:hypothetical protein